MRVDATDYNEYRKRVDYLYNVCQKNGLKIDNQNRNPSRLSRMSGVVRNGQKQFRIGTLKDISTEDTKAPWQKASEKRKKSAEQEREEKNKSLEIAIQSCN